MNRTVVFSPDANRHLASLHAFISATGSPRTAGNFVTSIKRYCDGFATFPKRGRRRDDLRSGLRFVGFRKKVTIAFQVDERQVIILGVYYGGQDVETLLANDLPANDE